MEDEYRKMMKELGYNLLILPRGQRLDNFYDAGYAAQTMPEEYAARLSAVGTSLYWWQGKISEAQEYELGLKSTLKLYPEIEALIRAEHPYQTPEIVATAYIAGSDAYLAWLEEELRQ